MSKARCSICGGTFPEAQVFILNGQSVCAECKPTVLARVLRGESEPVKPVIMDDRVMGFWETVGVGWKVIRAEWLPLLLLGLIVAVPLNWLLHQVPSPEEPSMSDVSRSWRLEQAAELFFGIIVTLGTAWITQERLEGRRATLGGAFRHAFRRWLPSIGTAWLERIFLVFFFLLLIIPGVIYLGYYTFSTIAVSLRDCGGTSALAYSTKLVKGRWWRVVGYTLGYFLPGVLLVAVMAFASDLLPSWPYLELVTDIVSSLVLGVTMVFVTVLFLNLDAWHRAHPTGGESGSSLRATAATQRREEWGSKMWGDGR